jgi:large subunit ribosomal protein L4
MILFCFAQIFPSILCIISFRHFHSHSHCRPAHFRGGAKAHGPKGIIQDYTTKLNKKVRALGLRVALSQKLREGNLAVVDDFIASEAKTKVVNDALHKIGITSDRDLVLLVGGDSIDENFKVAATNFAKIHMLGYRGLNVFDILKNEKIIITKEGLVKLEAQLLDQ